MKAVHHVQEDDEHSQLLFPDIPLDLRVEVEREARRMAGYWAGKNIAHTFLGLIRDHDSKQVRDTIQEYLTTQDDPRLTEIMHCLEDIFLSREAAPQVVTGA
jgi:hydrogenase-4 component I